MSTEAPEFTPEAATSFLTEHGVDAKALEGVAPEELRSRYEFAQSIAGKASERALAKAAEEAAKSVPSEYKLTGGKDKDGKDIAPDETLAKDVAAFAKKHGLKPEAAQEAYDAYGRMREASNRAMFEQLEQLKKDWAQAALADKEIGGEKFAENRAIANEGMQAFADQELRDLLSATHERGTGLENHPAIIRLFFKLGNLAKQDRTVLGERGAGKPADARSFYGKSNMNP